MRCRRYRGIGKRQIARIAGGDAQSSRVRCPSRVPQRVRLGLQAPAPGQGAAAILAAWARLMPSGHLRQLRLIVSPAARAAARNHRHQTGTRVTKQARNLLMNIEDHGTGEVEKAQACAAAPDRDTTSSGDRQQRVQADVRLASQLGGQHASRERQVVPVLVPGALALTAADRRKPSMFAGTRVVEPDRAHLGAGSEQRGKERHFRVRRRPVVHWAIRLRQIGAISACLPPTARHSVQGFLLGRSQGGPQSWGREVGTGGRRGIRIASAAARSGRRVSGGRRAGAGFRHGKSSS